MADSRKRVLAVDDELGVRESIRILLSTDYDVATVASGDAALEAIQRERPHLVLLDIIMPGMDGMELLERIRATDPGLPVVILTATKTVRTAVAAMKLGAFDYLKSPSMSTSYGSSWSARRAAPSSRPRSSGCVTNCAPRGRCVRSSENHRRCKGSCARSGPSRR